MKKKKILIGILAICVCLGSMILNDLAYQRQGIGNVSYTDSLEYNIPTYSEDAYVEINSNMPFS